MAVSWIGCLMRCLRWLSSAPRRAIRGSAPTFQRQRHLKEAVDARAVLSTQHRNPQHDAASQVLLAQQVSGRQEEGTRNGCGAAPTSALAPIAAAGPVGG
jgi:hypothetical protein